MTVAGLGSWLDLDHEFDQKGVEHDLQKLCQSMALSKPQKKGAYCTYLLSEDGSGWNLLYPLWRLNEDPVST